MTTPSLPPSPLPSLYQPSRLWTGKQVISVMLCPNRSSSVEMNLRTKGKQYSCNEDMCVNDSCEWGGGEVTVWGEGEVTVWGEGEVTVG